MKRIGPYSSDDRASALRALIHFVLSVDDVTLGDLAARLEVAQRTSNDKATQFLRGITRLNSTTRLRERDLPAMQAALQNLIREKAIEGR